MSRKRAIALAGIFLLTALALIDRATRSDPVVPATVAAIVSTPANSGPDNWHMDVTLSDGTDARIDYHGIRPNRTVGTPLCVIEKKRSWAKTVYVVTSQTNC